MSYDTNDEVAHEVMRQQEIADYMRQPGVGVIGMELGLRARDIQTSRNFTFMIEEKIAHDRQLAAFRRRQLSRKFDKAVYKN